MVFAVGEKTPLQPHKKNAPTGLATNRWILAVMASCSGLVLFGFLAHWHHMSTRSNLPRTSPHASSTAKTIGKSPRLRERAGEFARHAPKEPADSFRQCNPSVQAASHTRLPTVFERRECRSEQAALIHVMLRNEKYSYDAVVPHPYTYPAHILETLLAMDDRQQRSAIEHLRLLAEKLGRLGTFVKLFAWGVPVTTYEIMQAVGNNIAVFTALRDCGIVVNCEAFPDVVTSSVQLFPIQQPSIVVATDWHLPQGSYHEVTAEKRIEAVDVHDIFLIMNTPQFSEGDQTKILNMASGSGVIGLAAAARGASVVLLDENPRAANFGRFNSWLNLLSHRVRVALSDTDVKGHDFFLILSHPAGERVDTTIRAVLEATRSSEGMSVISFEGQSCESFTEQYNSEFCGEAGENHADLAGSVACRNPHGQGYDSDVISKEAMAFIWRGAIEDANKKPLEEMDKCGHFKTRHLRSLIGSVGVPACKFGREDMLCPEIDSFQDIGGKLE